MPKLVDASFSKSRVGARRARGMKVSSSLAEINVVPLVDVMLVLLVIFMVAAPMMKQGVPIQLPQMKRGQALDATPVTVSIPLSFRRDGRVRLDDEWVPIDVLQERVRQAVSGKLNADVVLAGDGGVTLQEFTTVMDRLRQGGVNNVGFQTQPLAGRLP